MRVFVIGDIIYAGYTPQAAGRVIAVIPGKGPSQTPMYTIQKVNGAIADIMYPKSYQDLIDDHKKKLAGHEARMLALKAMA